MVRVIAPNGVAIEASDEAAPLLLANGYARADAEDEAEQGKAIKAEPEPEKKDTPKRASRARASRSRG